MLHLINIEVLQKLYINSRTTQQKEHWDSIHLESKAARPIPPLQGINRVDLLTGLDVYIAGLVSDLTSLTLRSTSLLKNIRSISCPPKNLFLNITKSNTKDDEDNIQHIRYLD